LGNLKIGNLKIPRLVSRITKLPDHKITQSGLHDFAAAQAGSAHANAPGRALNLGVDRAEIDVPAPLGHVVGVADVISKLRPLAADLANLCHDCSGWDQKLIREI
jgi:hypothetical protein